MRKTLMIDLRMYRRSGIGRYLQLLMPNLIPRLNASNIILLCNPREVEGVTWCADPRIQTRDFQVPIFTLSEQLAWLRGVYSDADLLWTPQYNIPLGYRGKLVVTVHDLVQLAYPQTLANGLQRWYARRLFCAVGARAKAILCVSEFTASEVRRYLGVDGTRTVVTYPDLPTLEKSDITDDSSLAVRPYLLAVGNVKTHKNLRSLIEAFDRIRSQIPHNLIIIGRLEGFRNSDISVVSASKSLEGRVRFIGYVPDEKLSCYYRDASALVFPSIYEGFGFPVLEAMAHGCPVACSNVSASPEVAGDAALFFDPFDVESIASAIIKITTDKGLRDELTRRGYTRIERFRSKDCSDKTAAVINGIMGLSDLH